MGLLSNRVGLLSNGWAYFEERGFSKKRPLPLWVGLKNVAAKATTATTVPMPLTSGKYGMGEVGGISTE